MSKETATFARYEELRRALLSVRGDFRRGYQSYPQLYNQLILSPDPSKPLSPEAWEAFQKANGEKECEGYAHVGWKVWPGGTHCSRFLGTGGRVAIEEFCRIAESADDVLLEFATMEVDGNPVPEDFKIELTSLEGPEGYRFLPGWCRWLSLVYDTAWAVKTTFLHVEGRMWGRPDWPQVIEKRVGPAATRNEWAVEYAHLRAECEDKLCRAEGDVVFPLHPDFQLLRHDVFRSSVEAINVWLDSDKTVCLALDERPPVCLPPTEESDDLGDNENEDEPAVMSPMVAGQESESNQAC